MSAGEILSSIISGVSVVILAAIARGLLGVRKEFRQFMTEHMWLLATTLWSRDKVLVIMRELGLAVDIPPPGDLRDGAGTKKDRRN